MMTAVSLGLVGTDVPLGEWLPIEHPANGKAAEGFFVYLVSFNPKKAYDQFSNGTEIVIENQAYPNVPRYTRELPMLPNHM